MRIISHRFSFCIKLSLLPTSKFGIVLVRLILLKAGVHGFTELTGKWCQIRKWFLTHIEDITMEIEIFAPIYQRFSKQQESLALLASDWYWEKLGFADLLDRNMKLMSNIKQSNFKGFSVKVEIITPYYHSNWISKQPVSLPLLLSDWYCQKLGLTDLPGHYEKSTSDMNLVLNFFERT